MEEERQMVTDYFSTIGLSPLKSHSQPMPCKITAGKRKICDAVSSIKVKVAKTLDVPVDCLLTQTEIANNEIQKKAAAFDILMAQLKEKISSLSDSKSKIQILTQAPATWSIIKKSEYFNVS